MNQRLILTFNHPFIAIRNIYDELTQLFCWLLPKNLPGFNMNFSKPCSIASFILNTKWLWRMREVRPHKINPRRSLVHVPTIANIQCKQIGLIVIELSWTNTDHDSFLVVELSLMFHLHFHCCICWHIRKGVAGEQRLRVLWGEKNRRVSTGGN